MIDTYQMKKVMKKIPLFLCMLACTLVQINAQTCSTCDKLKSGASSGRDSGPDFSMSLGNLLYGQSAGAVTFSSSAPAPTLFTPTALQYDSPSMTNIVTVITTNQIVTNTVLSIATNTVVFLVTNTVLNTNVVYMDGTTTNTVIVTNTVIDQIWTTTNMAVDVFTVTNTVIRQVQAPQAIADVPAPPTTNGYVINFYYPSQVTGQVGGIDQFSGQPFISWMITNSNPSTINQLQVSETNLIYNSFKQWTYTYAPANGAWAMQPLGGAIQENMTVTNLNASSYQVINTVQAPTGPVVQQVVNTYQTFLCTNVVLVQTALGSSSSPEITTYSYWDPTTFGANCVVLLKNVVHPDGSWEYYSSYDANGNPLIVYSSFQDVSAASYSSGRKTAYTYSTSAVSGSGDNGTCSPNTPRQVVNSINSQEIARQYTAFPSVGVRLDIQCTIAGAAWYATGNLITTNIFYTSGPNQFALQAVVRPDGTMTTFNYFTNATYQTNITVTGQPDAGYSYIVDGVSNRTVINQWGYNVTSISQDVLSSLIVSQDVYGNYDGSGRPQQVVHLDGTTNVTQYACCGLDLTIDPDGVITQYIYDPAKRSVGYQKIYNGSPITYTNVLDAAGRTLQFIRAGSDNSIITMNQSAYDLAGEKIGETNALNGGTVYTRTNDSVTGGVTQTIIYPNGGMVTNFYFADGSLKMTIGAAIHGIRYNNTVESDGGAYRLVNWQIKLNASGSDSSEYTKTFADFAGRNYKTVFASASGTPAVVLSYNAKGQLASQADPDGVANLYAYNSKGETMDTAIDMNANGTIDFSGTDRITYTVSDVTTDHSTNVRRTRTYVWNTLNANSTNLVSTVESSTDGLKAWQTQYRDATTAVTNQSQTLPGSSRVVTTIASDNSYTINTYSYGRLVSSTRYDSTGAQIGATTYAYDPHGRQYQVTDARNGTSTYSYNNADLVITFTTPNPGTPGSAPQTTTTSYNNLLQSTNVMQPDGTSVASTYLLTGELGLQSGSRTYPVGYSYDYAGRMQRMTNWSGYPSTGARVTTWNYDQYRGFLTSKAYADGNGPSYTYTAAGRLHTRLWSRGITTTDGYDNAGGLNNVSYSDSTPAVTTTFDRLGHASSVVCNGMTDTLTYNLANQLLTESFSGGSLNGLSVTNGYDQFLRRTNLTALASGVLNQAAYGYDNASRLLSVSDGTNNANYSYVANSPLVNQVVFKQNSTLRMTTTKSYDYLNRLTAISSAASNTVSFNYNYNAANQRTRDTLADGSYWIYTYDSLGQVTGGNKFWSDETPVAGQQFDYLFDTIGNRTQTLSGGDQNGGYLRAANYYANPLNQITNRDVSGYVDVKGASFATNTVTVNGQTAYRKGEYFRDELTVNNSSLALWTNLITAATGQASITGNVFVAKAPEAFGYDLDGNMTNDGRWAYTWDGENRLIDLTSLSTAPGGSQMKLDFGYDGQCRRIQKMVSTNNGSSYFPQSTNRFLYDRWNLVAEVKPNNTLIRSYMWGTDLSGSMQGAGGVGGLLEVSYYGSSTTNSFPAFDGNGNLAALVNAADGTTLANYEYGPFGEPIRITGAIAKSNPFLFSTKYYELESGLYYYGYRFYNPSTGGWPDRDPLQETDGANLYAFIHNNSITAIDSFGRLTFRTEVIVGHFYNEWASPSFAGDGSYVVGDNFASSWVYLDNEPPPWWWPFSINSYCNTVNATGLFNNTASDAGTINVYAKDPCGGTFLILGSYTATIAGSGPKSGYGSATLNLPTGGGSVSHIQAVPNSPTATASVIIYEMTTLDPGKEKLVAQYVPYLNIPPGDFTSANVSASIMVNGSKQ
jgi:RHS repeat-associated protein